MPEVLGNCVVKTQLVFPPLCQMFICRSLHLHRGACGVFIVNILLLLLFLCFFFCCHFCLIQSTVVGLQLFVDYTTLWQHRRQQK